jgi:hypothetical protein
VSAGDSATLWSFNLEAISCTHLLFQRPQQHKAKLQKAKFVNSARYKNIKSRQALKKPNVDMHNPNTQQHLMALKPLPSNPTWETPEHSQRLTASLLHATRGAKISRSTKSAMRWLPCLTAASLLGMNVCKRMHNEADLH